MKKRSVAMCPKCDNSLTSVIYFKNSGYGHISNYGYYKLCGQIYKISVEAV